ncbi:MAG: hypothetical protein C0396_09410 [Anaerolinea sp.]|nr:hypothetical protein [Anaerolinea sp.]
MLPRFFLVLTAALLLLGAWVLWSGMKREQAAIQATATPTHTSLPGETVQPPTPTAAATLTLTNPTPAGAPTGTGEVQYPDGLIVLSLSDGYYRHLFAYHPSDLQFTRLTDHPWDDIHPAVSPDGTRLAYASRRNGYWDIYIFDFTTGQSTRVTNTPAYDGNPTWAPDGQWLAYVSYQTGNLDIFIQSLADLSQPALQLTTDPAADTDPDWSPGGNLLAFTSQRSGESEIWTAALDQPGNRFQNRSQNPESPDRDPAWSPDGQQLAWSTRLYGMQTIVVAAAVENGEDPQTLGAGIRPLWDPAGGQILAQLDLAEGTSLTGYNSENGQVTLPPKPLPAALHGADWQSAKFANALHPYLLVDSGDPRKIMAGIQINQPTEASTGRVGLVTLNGINAPYPYLSDQVDESFFALRQEIARVSGWDVLANLQNAYLPITEPSLPGIGDDWLVTGMGIAINPLPYQAGWMAIQREDLGGEAYWRLYIRARYQDGSQGEPITAPVWNLDARSSGDPNTYEQGGATDAAPAGYWIDFTELAARFNWQRLPAYPNWRTYYAAARFNQFAYSVDRGWDQAMQRLYPVELVHRPTQIPTLTSFPTNTPLPLNDLTATAQVTPWQGLPANFEPRPTWTPVPGETFP